MTAENRFSKDKNSITVGSYTVDTGNNVSFTVIFKENAAGLREFEIMLSANGSDDYDEVFNNAFYTNFVLPWTYHKQELPEQMLDTPKAKYTNNIVQMKRGTHGR
jgi:hypothetical protein